MGEQCCPHGFQTSMVACPDGRSPSSAPLPQKAWSPDRERGGRKVKYLSSEIREALARAKSQAEAARLLGMSSGALRKRCEEDPELRPSFEAVRARSTVAAHSHPAFVDMMGQVCGGWAVLERAKNSGHGNARWKCRHSCGAVHVVQAIALRSNPPKFCDTCRPRRPGTVLRLTRS